MFQIPFAIYPALYRIFKYRGEQITGLAQFYPLRALLNIISYHEKCLSRVALHRAILISFEQCNFHSDVHLESVLISRDDKFIHRHRERK